MSEPDQGGATQAKQEITRQIKTANADTNLRASLKEPPPPPNIFDQLGMGFGTASKCGTGYQIDPEALAALIRTFENLRDRSWAQFKRLIQAAASATPPSPDEPSVNQAKATRDSFIKAAEHNRDIFNYAQGLIDALHKAKDTYCQADQDIGTTFKEWSRQ